MMVRSTRQNWPRHEKSRQRRVARDRAPVAHRPQARRCDHRARGPGCSNRSSRTAVRTDAIPCVPRGLSLRDAGLCAGQSCRSHREREWVLRIVWRCRCRL